MGRYFPNIQPLMLDAENAESEIHAGEVEFSHALSRLAALDVYDETKALFQRYINGELTVHELSAAIDSYLMSKH